MRMTVDIPEGNKLISVSDLEHRMIRRNVELFWRVAGADEALLPDDVLDCVRDLRSMYEELQPGDPIEGAQPTDRDFEEFDR